MLAHSEARKVRGPTLLKDIWKLPPGKTINVQFNNRNQPIGKEGRKLASFLGIVARTPELTPLNIDDWRAFDKEEKKRLVEFVRNKFSIPRRGEEFVKKSLGKKWKDYKSDLKTMYMAKHKTKDALLKNKPSRIPRDQWIRLVAYWTSEKAKKRTQANRINRAKQKRPHTGGSKSLAILMNEKAVNGKEPTRAAAYLLTHSARKDGRPLDEESADVVEMIEEKLRNGETSDEQPPGSVAWEGDVYSQVLGEERSGYVRGLGLGPTPSLLWGGKSYLGSINVDSVSVESVNKLEKEVNDLKKKHDEEMSFMKQTQDMILKKHDEEIGVMKQTQNLLLSELSWWRQMLCKVAPQDIPQNFRGSSSRQVPDANSSHRQAR